MYNNQSVTIKWMHVEFSEKKKKLRKKFYQLKIAHEWDNFI